MMKILMIGDVFGQGGRKAVKRALPKLVDENGIDLVIANAENLAGGHGLDRKRLHEMWDEGVHLCTTGNHVWQNKDIFEFIDSEPRLVRPANFPEPCPGRGFTVQKAPNGVMVVLINLLGRIFMQSLECPFKTMDRILERFGSEPKVILVDFHAEATSEKIALSWYLDGRVSAVVGTHTHVQTADERILPRGTGAITDLGMTGPHDSVIGMGKDAIIQQFLDRRPVRFTAAKNDLWFHGVLLDVDEKTGKTKAIRRIREHIEEA
jgi:metallophosphoesterase (TIGR00282 family)